MSIQIVLTENQKDIKRRIKESIETEIGMCDDYADLLLLATILFQSSRNIFSPYAETYGEGALVEALDVVKKYI